MTPAEQGRRLTIGIDARAAAEVRAGRGRLVRELLRELALRDDPHRYRLYVREPWEEPLDARFEWHQIGARDPWWHLRAARAASRECDVFLSSNSYLTTWFTTIPAVPVVYDLVGFERSLRPNRRSSVIERLTLGPAMRRSRAVIAISQATANALTARFPVARAKTSVALLGVSRALAPEADPPPDLPEPGFVLAVGTLEPRKNLPRLVAAYRALPEATQREHPLVVVGPLGWDTGETLDALADLGSRCRRLGYVSDTTLYELYRRCALFCYPSLGEGFGLPVLEAMDAGAAVLTSSVSSLPEVGGDAVAYADPLAAIASVLRRLLGDSAERERLGGLARERAATFSWERFAAEVLGVLAAAART